jgi:positive regulator of sigma E activity
MQRTLFDDLKWALCMLVGFALFYLVLLALGDDDPASLAGSVVGLAVAIVVLNIFRRARRVRRS